MELKQRRKNPICSGEQNGLFNFAECIQFNNME